MEGCIPCGNGGSLNFEFITLFVNDIASLLL